MTFLGLTRIRMTSLGLVLVQTNVMMLDVSDEDYWLSSTLTQKMEMHACMVSLFTITFFPSTNLLLQIYII